MFAIMLKNPTKENSQKLNAKQYERDVQKQREPIGVVRLRSKRNDLAASVPCERQTQRNIVAAEHRRKRGDRHCGYRDEHPFEYRAHTRPNG
jgi:hypothetical protein